MNWLYTKIEQFNTELAEAPEWLLDLFGGTNVVDAMLNNSLQFFVLATFGWLIATLLERKHLKYLVKKEQEFSKINVNNLKVVASQSDSQSAFLMGSVVMAHDYFRGFFIMLQKLLGGNISAYERITQRGRREALIRLQQNALQQGFNKVINVRFDSTKVANHITAIEIIAYGTGIKETVR